MIHDNERELLHKAFNQIKTYVESRIVPRLSDNESIYVTFGTLTDPDMGFGCNAIGDIWLQIGYLRLSFNQKAEANIYGGYSYGRHLVLQWQDVKARLNTELNRRDQEYYAIMNFEV